MAATPSRNPELQTARVPNNPNDLQVKQEASAGKSSLRTRSSLSPNKQSPKHGQQLHNQAGPDLSHLKEPNNTNNLLQLPMTNSLTEVTPCSRATTPTHKVTTKTTSKTTTTTRSSINRNSRTSKLPANTQTNHTTTATASGQSRTTTQTTLTTNVLTTATITSTTRVKRRS